jgi:hypothetical protein
VPRERDSLGTDFITDGSNTIYALTFQTGKAKDGTVQLTMTGAPVTPPTLSD